MPNMDSDFETKLKNKVGKPRMYKVVILNDDFTSQEFVVELLKKFFNKNDTEANMIMLLVHKSGKGLVGTYTKDIAETKVSVATDYARKNGFPLMLSLESE